MHYLPAILCLLSVSVLAANDQNLPTLGDAASGTVSLTKEREIGQDFLRSLRAQAPTMDDPILQDYLEHLIYRLAANSQLTDRRLDLVIIDSPVLNAFAAPGGVVGVHHGLFSHGESEHEISAILAHELAHLSQRHFARGVEAGRKSTAISMAGLLASIVLMTTVGGDAGIAALQSTQAVAISHQLRHSRGREVEADRVGIDTLLEAGMDPRAMAYMFERLERASRYDADEMPEFLRTHPVTRARIADAYNQTVSQPRADFPLNIDFHLMKARVKAMAAPAPAEVLPAFRAGMTHEHPVIRTANTYGLVLALTEGAKFDEAMRYLRPLLEDYPNKISLLIAEADIHRRAQRPDIALDRLGIALDVNPRNYPLSMALAQTLLANQQTDKAVSVLLGLTSERSNDDFLWYHLAEAYGLARDIPGVHWARAEYFVLNGNYEQAIKQLEYALPLVRRKFQQEAKIKQRLHELRDKSG